MADIKPTFSLRKPWIIAPVLIASAIFIIVLVARYEEPTAPAAPPAGNALPDNALPRTTPAPPQPTILNRRDLIDFARAAAATFAVQNVADIDRSLVGRRFDIRIPFGCSGIQSGAAQLNVSYSGENNSLTLSAQPAEWLGLPLMQGIENLDNLTSVEGFWLPRPWKYSEQCSPGTEYPVPATPTPPTSQTIGLAQLFGKGDSRVMHHVERPYTHTIRLAESDFSQLNRSYYFRIQGRLTSFANGNVLRCWMETPDHHPICLFSVELSEVAFEDGTTNATLAKWGN